MEPDELKQYRYTVYFKFDIIEKELPIKLWGQGLVPRVKIGGEKGVYNFGHCALGEWKNHQMIVKNHN